MIFHTNYVRLQSYKKVFNLKRKLIKLCNKSKESAFFPTFFVPLHSYIQLCVLLTIRAITMRCLTMQIATYIVCGNITTFKAKQANIYSRGG